MACFYRLLALALLVMITGGCQHARHTDYAAFVKEPRPAGSGQGYRVGVPDELVVTVASEDGHRTLTQTLGPDGQLRLEGFAPVDAAGRTCEQIAHDLRAIAALSVPDDEHAADADLSISVRVRTFASQKVFAFGQVRATGGQAYDGTTTVLDVVAAAQPNVRADTRHVQVLRPSPDGSLRRRMTVDLDAMVRGGDTTLNVVLDPDDVVYVPATALGTIGLAFEQVFGSTSYDKTPPRDQLVDIAPPPTPSVCIGPTETMTPHKTASPIVTEITGLEELWESLALLTAELQLQREVREASAEPATSVESIVPHSLGVERDRVVWEPQPSQSIWHQGPPLPEPVVFSTAEVQRGGVGESAHPEDVQFWGP